MRDRAVEDLVDATMAGDHAAAAELAARWAAGAAVGPMLHAAVRRLIAGARAMGWTDDELLHVHGRRDRVLRDLLHAGLSPDPAALDRWRHAHRVGASTAVGHVLVLGAVLAAVREPPGGPAADPPPGGSPVDAGLLDRVRALLAKAESTTFEAEADALTAKAHELMARHAIADAVLAAGGRTRGGDVRSRRILVEDPYARAKWQLLAVIAAACGCRTVSTADGAVVVVFGHAGDLDAVDVLHASLRLQSTTAMLAAGRTPERRTRGFRSAFLLAFAARVGDRLLAATDAAVAAATADHGDALLPVLASKAEAVDAAVAAAFPRLRTARPGAVRNAAGWHAGWRAADRADVGPRTPRLGARRALRR